jgi:peroxiredoxin
MNEQQTETVGDTETTAPYNYRRFESEYYDFETFDGPGPGDEAVDFEAYTLDGDPVQLSDFEGQWVVLETGSITCPVTDSKVHPMDDLQRQFDDVAFLLLYTREAHPGENYEVHGSLEDKLQRARTFADEYGIERTVLVDDVDGTAHRSYGGMPNSVHVISPDGVVVMRGDWNKLGRVEEVLENRDPTEVYEQDLYRGTPHFTTHRKGAIRVMKNAGPRAVWDFLRNLPRLGLMHLKKELRDKKAN